MELGRIGVFSLVHCKWGYGVCKTLTAQIWEKALDEQKEELAGMVISNGISNKTYPVEIGREKDAWFIFWENEER